MPMCRPLWNAKDCLNYCLWSVSLGKIKFDRAIMKLVNVKPSVVDY